MFEIKFNLPKQFTTWCRLQLSTTLTLLTTITMLHNQQLLSLRAVLNLVIEHFLIA